MGKSGIPPPQVNNLFVLCIIFDSCQLICFVSNFPMSTCVFNNSSYTSPQYNHTEECSMTPEKVVSVINRYKNELTHAGVVATCIDPRHTLASCTVTEILSHALFLIEQFDELCLDRQFAKASRQLSAIQICLSFAGLYSLNELKLHNRP